MKEVEFEFESLAEPPVKCCRCFPSCVNERGICGCCLFDHANGTRSNPEPEEVV